LEEEEKEYFIAYRDVKKGEELTMTYLTFFRTRTDRQARLKQYGFECQCSACSLPPSEIGRNDSARLELSNISDFIDDTHPYVGSLVKLHGICCRGIELLRQEKITSFFEVELAHGAFMVNTLFGCRPLAKMWAQELLKLMEQYGVIGKERVERRRCYEVLEEDPTCHPAWSIYGKGE